jgi:hypothetical protein
VVERRSVKSTTDNGAQQPLEQRIASALNSDTSLSAADVRALLDEVDAASAAAANAIEQERANAVDPFDPSDPATRSSEC